MSRQAPTLAARPLAGRKLEVGDDSDFVIAEWLDDGSMPGQLIAPPHVHLDDDEAWYVLEGRLAFQVGDEVIDAPAGTAVYGLHGLAHTYWNPTSTPARYLLVMRPRTARLLESSTMASAATGRRSKRCTGRIGCDCCSKVRSLPGGTVSSGMMPMHHNP